MNEGGGFVTCHASLGNSPAQLSYGRLANLKTLRTERSVSERQCPVDVDGSIPALTVTIHVIQGAPDSIGCSQRALRNLLEHPTQHRVRQSQGSSADRPCPSN